MPHLLARIHGTSFQHKIVGLCVAATVAALALTFGVFEIQDWIGDRAELRSDEIARAQGLAAEAGAAVDGRDVHAAARAKAMFNSDNDEMRATYYSLSGKQFALVSQDASTPATGPAGVSATDAQFVGDLLQVHAPAFLSGRKVGELVLTVSQRDMWSRHWRNQLVALGLSTLATLLVAIATAVLARRALKPLTALDDAMADVSRTGDFNVSVPSTSHDEFGRLTDSFNILIGEVRRHDDALQATMADLIAAKDAAEEANVMKSQFLANMSHEIRTPLNGVMGMAQVMALNPLSAPQRERLDVIEKSGANLLSVLNDVLDLSKIEAGRMELEEAPFDIEEVASGALAAFTSIAKGKGLSFRLDVAETAKGSWRGDSARLRQMLYNLISNALKFTARGHVNVAIESVDTAAGRALSIAIEDTGIGIPAAAIPRLFQKFVQADNTVTRRFGGTGLGLTICRHMAELMGGDIQVESEVGKGSIFTVLLPLPWLGPRPALASPPSLSERDRGRGKETGLQGLRVLAAEDNVTNQLVLRTILNSLGVEPLIVDNGQEAVEAWAPSRFDLVLMDIQMPVMDGVSATKAIRAREREFGLGPTPIVAVSANAMKHQVDEYLAAGMDAHVAKPIEVRKLFAMLNAVADGRALQDAA